MKSHKKYNNKKKNSMKRKNKLVIDGGIGMGSLRSLGSMGGPSIVDEMQNINPQDIIKEIIKNPEIKPHIMQFIDFLKNLDENQIDKELTEIINNKDNKYILNNIVFVLSKVPLLTPIFVSLKGSCMVETLTATGISTMLIPLHKKHIGNVIGIVKNSIGGVVEEINKNIQDNDKINSQEIGNKIEKLINKLIDKEVDLYHKYCEYSNDLKFGLVLMLPPVVADAINKVNDAKSGVSSGTSTPGSTPVNPSASTTTDAAPINPSASTTTTDAAPINPSASTTTTDAAPINPSASTTTDAAPINPSASTNADAARPENVEVKVIIDGNEQIAEKVTGLGGLGCIFGNCIKLDEQVGSGTRNKKSKKHNKKKTQKKQSKRSKK